MFEAITSFKGEYYFLSNFYSAPVVFEGVRYENNEAAFQAAKCPSRKHEFCNLNPSEAKQLGRQVELRPDWEDVKDSIMYRICKEKFMQNPDIRVKLIGTKDAELVEGNDWNDTIWGVCNGVGENRLGKILMRVREEIKLGYKCEHGECLERDCIFHQNSTGRYAESTDKMPFYYPESAWEVECCMCYDMRSWL